MTLISKLASAVLLAATMVAVPSWAGAAPMNAGAMKSADTNPIVQARWVGHRGGWGPGAVVGGIAAGIAGAAIADGAYGYYGPYGPYAYYEPGYVYGYGPYWGGPYWRYRHWHHW
jgi:hypothetical protein